MFRAMKRSRRNARHLRAIAVLVATAVSLLLCGCATAQSQQQARAVPGGVALRFDAEEAAPAVGGGTRRSLQGSGACSRATCPANSRCVSTDPDDSPAAYKNTPVCRCNKGRGRFVRNRLMKPVCKRGSDDNGVYLAPHNNARAALGLPPLTWNKKAAVKAAEWAAVLKGRECKMEHGPTGNAFGQNLAMLWGPASWVGNTRRAMNLWVGEGALYQRAKFEPPKASGCSTGKWTDCGHYTQVMWRSTRSVGCAFTTCGSSGQLTRLWVCHYDPPGNFVGEYPY